MIIPALIPVTTPATGSILPIAGLLLLQLPPGVASLKVIDCPTHTPLGPKIGNGNGLTVIFFDALHPVAAMV